MSKIVQIDSNNWKKFLEEFTERNNNRRARFEIFRVAETEEESQEYHLEDILIKQNGDENNVVIMRVDRTKPETEKIKDTITNVRGIAVQYDTDGSEDVLEITDKENELINLRL